MKSVIEGRSVGGAGVDYLRSKNVQKMGLRMTLSGVHTAWSGEGSTTEKKKMEENEWKWMYEWL